MPYGIIKVDTITFTDGGADKTVSISGLVQNPTFSGNITVTGTISGNVIRGGTTVSGATVTGTAGQFGTLTGNTAGFTTITGATVTGTVAQFTTITGGTTGFTTVTGATVTGTTANFTTLSGTTVTGNAGSFTTVTGGVATITSGVFAVGAEALPSISFASDPNTGIYSPGADQVAISTGGSGRLFVDASGNVKITSSQHQAISHKNFGYSGSYGAVTIGAAGNNYANVALGIDISGIAGGAFNGNNQVIFPANGALLPNNAGNNFIGVFSRNSSDSILIGPNTSSGITNGPLTVTSTSLGIGTSSPSKLLTIGTSSTANTTVRLNCSQTAGSDTGMYSFGIDDSTDFAGMRLDFTDRTSKGLQIFTAPGFGYPISFSGSSGNQDVTIDASGRVGIGTTSPGMLLTINNATTAQLQFGYSDSIYGRIGRDSSGNYEFSSYENGGNLKFGTTGTTGSTTERARIDSSGRLLVGTSSSRQVNASIAALQLQIEGTTYQSSSMSLVTNQNAADGSYIILGKSRGTSLGSSTIVNTNDLLGALWFCGADGTDLKRGATIEAVVDGTPGANDMPGRLVFSTTADGASSPTERVRITQSGRLICGRDVRDATLESTDQFVIEGNGYSAFHALNATAYTIGQNSNSRALRIGSGGGWATTGVSLAAGGTSWGTYSDERLKTDIVELSDCLDSIKDVRCISYRLTDVDTAESKKRLGIIAQDLVGKYDEAINESRRSDDDETEYLSVQYTDLVPVLIKALQEASSKIETLEARLTALESA